MLGRITGLPLKTNATVLKLSVAFESHLRTRKFGGEPETRSRATTEPLLLICGNPKSRVLPLKPGLMFRADPGPSDTHTPSKLEALAVLCPIKATRPES